MRTWILLKEMTAKVSEKYSPVFHLIRPYDLGVCGALEVMETLAQSGVSGNGVNYRMVIFAEEEGSGFGSNMTGSKFISGIYKDENLDSLKRDDGKSLREILSGLSPHPSV